MSPTACTSTAQAWWLNHAEHAGVTWCEHYWDDWQALRRRYVLLALSLLPPVTSLYEIGCNSGPNLRLIQSTFPQLALAGCEIAKVAGQLAQDRLGVPVTIGSLPDVLDEDAPQADVYLSMYTMAYLDPEDAHVTMLRLNRLAQVALILVEPMAMAGLPLGQCRDDGLPEWRHDYERTLGALGWHMTWKWPLVPPVQNMNALLVMSRLSATSFNVHPAR